MTRYKTLDDLDLKLIAQRVAYKMLVDHGEAAAPFLYNSGKMGAAFAKITYDEIRAEMEKPL